MSTTSKRLFFLDWVRIIAFFVLIFYHVGMYYVSWDWHVKSPFAGKAIEPLMFLSSPWRLGLLFLVSGAAASFMLAKMRAPAFMRQRSARLLVPLLFGMLVIVPPQPYFEVVEKVAYQGGYLDFMKLYLTSYKGFCRGDDCLDMPTWNHLWFVAYLWVYTLCLGALAMLMGPRFDGLAARTAALLTGWKLFAVPVIMLALFRVWLSPIFETTHALIDDWYSHANYFFLFLLGALLARDGSVWARFDAARWSAVGIALTCWAALVIYFSLPETVSLAPTLEYWRWFMRCVYSLCAWSAMVAACGFAHRHLHFDSPRRRYLAQAVFPVYIVHQTLIVSIAHLIKPARIAPAVEGPLLVVLTLCLSFGLVELVRRCRPLHAVFGFVRQKQAGPVIAEEARQQRHAA